MKASTLRTKKRLSMLSGATLRRVGLVESGTGAWLPLAMALWSQLLDAECVADSFLDCNADYGVVSAVELRAVAVLALPSLSYFGRQLRCAG